MGEPWFRARYRPDDPSVSLIRRGSGEGVWADPGCEYILDRVATVDLVVTLLAALRAWDDALTAPAAPPPERPR